MPGRGCIADHRPLRNLAQLVAPFRFAGTGGALVRRFKLDGDVAAGLLLARAMRQAWRQCRSSASRHVVVPVPLHRTRRRERGFDQAAWLAGRIADRWGWPLGSAVLVRERATRPQGDPRTTSRERNVEGAFQVAAEGALVRGRSVLLIDDVFTTGATLRACAAVLRDADAGVVSALVACRS